MAAIIFERGQAYALELKMLEVVFDRNVQLHNKPNYTPLRTILQYLYYVINRMRIMIYSIALLLVARCLHQLVLKNAPYAPFPVP